jgi:chromosome segregation ATPase
MPQRRLSEKQTQDLSSLAQGCRNVLIELDTKLKKHENLGTNPQSLIARSQKAWHKIKWDQDEIRELRDRITSNTGLLNAFNASLSR